MYKYLVLFAVPNPHLGELEELARKMAEKTGLPPPSLGPHVTFHRPIKNIAEEKILDLTESMVLQVKRTRVTVSHLFPFGKQFIVLPVHATRVVADLWTGITNLLLRLPEYEHGPYDDDNTLHITVAEKTHRVFDRIWPEVQNMFRQEMNIPMETIEVHRKPQEGGKWERIALFQIPK